MEGIRFAVAILLSASECSSRHAAGYRSSKKGREMRGKKKRLLRSSSRGELCRYIKTMGSAVKQTDRRQPARLDISGRASLAISVLALNYDEVSQVGSISRATNRKKTHTTCLCSARKRIDGSPLFTRRVQFARECTSGSRDRYRRSKRYFPRE